MTYQNITSPQSKVNVFKYQREKEHRREEDLSHSERQLFWGFGADSRMDLSTHHSQVVPLKGKEWERNGFFSLANVSHLLLYMQHKELIAYDYLN
jgi:hypothetical protein